MSVALAGVTLLAVFCAVLASAPQASAVTLRADREKARQLAGEIAGLDGRIDAAVDRYVKATQSLRAVKQAIRDNKQMRLLAMGELGLARNTLAVRAVALYKHNEVTAIDAFFTANDFGELIDQLTMVRSVARSDRNVLRTVETTKQELADRDVSLKADQRTAEKLVEARSAELKSIRSQLAARQALLDGVRAEIRSLATEIAQTTPSPTPTQPSSSPTPQDTDGHGPWWALIQASAGANGIDPHGMYRLMMIESGGNAEIVGAGGYYGLYQYAPTTWKGSWNPYRSSSITDGAAQIRATALALKLGYGHAWWDPSYTLAFGGG